MPTRDIADRLIRWPSGLHLRIAKVMAQELGNPQHCPSFATQANEKWKKESSRCMRRFVIGADDSEGVSHRRLLVLEHQAYDDDEAQVQIPLRALAGLVLSSSCIWRSENPPCRCQPPCHFVGNGFVTALLSRPVRARRSRQAMDALFGDSARIGEEVGTGLQLEGGWGGKRNEWHQHNGP
ncbi:hypothetical protein BJX70DRAFT_185196 [Aspergillus crustosus]